MSAQNFTGLTHDIASRILKVIHSVSAVPATLYPTASLEKRLIRPASLLRRRSGRCLTKGALLTDNEVGGVGTGFDS